MIWAYIAMRALYQAEKARTWYGVVLGVAGIRNHQLIRLSVGAKLRESE